jgi:hypothetical protein
MQTHDFEKHVQKELAEFSLEPTDSVWQNVELRINKERKKRRIVFFWLFAGIVLLGGGAGIFYMNSKDNGRHIANVERTDLINQNETDKIGKKVESSSPGDAAEKTSVVADNEQKNNGSLGQVKQKDNTNKQQGTSLQTTRAITTQNFKSRIKSDIDKTGLKKLQKSPVAIRKAGKQPRFIASPGDVSTGTQMNTSTEINFSHELSSNTQIETPASTNSNEVRANNAPEDSVRSAVPIATRKTTLPDSSVATTQQKKTSKRNWSYGFTSMIGVSDNLSGFNIGPSLAATRSISLSSTTASNVVPTLSLNFRSSVSFGLGFFAQKDLANRLAMEVGVAYQYYSTKSSIGSLNSSGRSFYDSTLAKQTNVAAYYSAGDNVNYTNHYHFIQLPINVLWQLNKSAEKPLTLFTGVTPAYLMGSNAIYANYIEGVYYQEKNQFSRFQLNGQLGLLFTVKSAGKYNLQLGPIAQYEFSSHTKSIISPKQHLLFFGLKSKFTIK